MFEIITRAAAKAGGLNLFFTGEPCRHGHIAQRLVASYGCVTCQRERVKKSRNENPELWRSYDKKKKRVRRLTPAQRERARQLYRINRERIRAARARELQSRVEYNRRWRSENPEMAATHSRRWRLANQAKVNAKRRQRQAVELCRTPPWVMPEDLVPAYEKARELTAQTGIKHHVDHIVPLQGRIVSGLHVPWNLQAIPARENLSKGNKFDQVTA